MLQALRADARRQAERRIVRDGKRLVIAFHADHRGDGAEYLFAADAHLVGAFGEERRLQIEAGRFAGQPLAAEDEVRALFAADIEVALLLGALAFVVDSSRTRVGLGKRS